MKMLKEHKWSLAGIVVLAIFLWIPMFIHPFYENDDTLFHVSNTISIEKSMSMHGGLGSTILPNIAHNFGYASHMLYPPLPHTVTAVFYHVVKHIGLTIPQVFKLMHFFVILASGLAMYELMFKLSKNKKLAFFSSFIYMSAPYLLSDHYVRDAFAECFIFPFLPLIISGLVSLFDGNKLVFFPLFVLGYVGGMLSHLILMIFFTLFMALFLLINYKKVFKKDFIFPFLVGCLSILLLTAFFIEPMMEYKLFGGIAVFEPNLMSGGIYWSNLWFHELLPFYRYGFDINFGFSLFPFLLLIGTFVMWKKLEKPKYILGIVILFFVTIFVSSKLFFWDVLPSFLFMLQFTWRLMTFLALFTALIAPLCLQKVRNKYILGVLLIAMVAMSVSEIHTRGNYLYCCNNETVVQTDGAMGWQKEYLPTNAHNNQDYWRKREYGIQVKHGFGAFQILEDNVPTLVFQVSDIKESVTIELPRLSYRGYELRNSKNELVDFYENDYGFIEIQLKENDTYTLKYPGTIGMQLTTVLSGVSIFVILTGYYLYCKNMKKGKN